MKIKTKLTIVVCLLILCTLGLVMVWRKYGQSPAMADRPPDGETEPLTPTQIPAETVTSFYVTPSVAPDLDPTERTQEVERFFSEMDQRIEDFYDSSSYRYGGEIVNPLFANAFSSAHMYVVAIIPGGTGDRPLQYTTMVSFEGRGYRMPEDFNRLMLDAGYSPNAKTLDDLAHALVVAALPTEMVIQPITCSRGRGIDETRPLGSCPDCLHFVYEIECQALYKDFDDIVVKLLKFEDHFRGGWMGWGGTTETGQKQFSYFFSTN